MNHLVRNTFKFIKYFLLILFICYVLFALKIIYDKRNEDIPIEEKLADGFIGGLFAGFIYTIEFINYVFYPEHKFQPLPHSNEI